MKRLMSLFTILIIISQVNIQAQEQIQLTDIEMINLGDGQRYATKKDTDKTPVDGKCRIITGYTTEYIDAEFKKGYAEGVWKYYKNNILTEEMAFAEGYLNGDQISYYPDGEVKSKATLKKGKVDGTAVAYRHDGTIESELTMEDGIQEGPEKYYNNDGSIRSRTEFKNGKAEGESFSIINYGMSDQYRIIQFYKNGLLHGPYTEVYTNDQDKVSGKYSEGKKTGVWEYFKQNGDRAKPTDEYDNDDLIKRTTYYTNGNVDMERGMRKGKYHGAEKKYTLEGKLKSEKNYIDGKQVGKQMVYMTSNQADYVEVTNYNDKGKKDGEYSQIYADTDKPKQKGQYVNDQKDGKWQYFNRSGKVEKEELYEKGSLKSSTRFEN